MADETIKSRLRREHMALIKECTADNGAFTGPTHTKPHDLIERERQTKLLAAILEKLHNS